MYLAAYICLLASMFCALAGSAIGAAQLWQDTVPNCAGWSVRKALAACVSLRVGHLLYALVVSDFTVEYVASYTERALPLFYRATAFWAGQAGSLLFWALMVSVCGTAFFVYAYLPPSF
jgi:cytochrome c-type biogenesis protein CcmF